MPGDHNLVSQVSSRVRIDCNASILAVALGFLKKSSCASPSLSSPHPLRFLWDPAFLPAQTTKGRAVPAPARCPAPSPERRSAAGKGGGPRPGQGWGECSFILPLSGQSAKSFWATRGPGSRHRPSIFPFFCHVPTIDVSPLLGFRLGRWIFPRRGPLSLLVGAGWGRGLRALLLRLYRGARGGTRRCRRLCFRRRRRRRCRLPLRVRRGRSRRRRRRRWWRLEDRALFSLRSRCTVRWGDFFFFF